MALHASRTASLPVHGTRAPFLSFSFQNTKRASLNFLEYISSHLESHDAPFEENIYLQTDWGAEYGGHQTRSVKRYDQALNLSLRDALNL